MQLSYATSAITDRAVYFLFLAFESPTTHFNFILSIFFCFVLFSGKPKTLCVVHDEIFSIIHFQIIRNTQITMWLHHITEILLQICFPCCLLAVVSSDTREKRWNKKKNTFYYTKTEKKCLDITEWIIFAGNAMSIRQHKFPVSIRNGNRFKSTVLLQMEFNQCVYTTRSRYTEWREATNKKIWNVNMFNTI